MYSWWLLTSRCGSEVIVMLLQETCCSRTTVHLNFFDIYNIMRYFVDMQVIINAVDKMKHTGK